MKKICSILLVVCILLGCFTAFAEVVEYKGESYTIKLFDAAKLLTEEEITTVVDEMQKVSAYANVGFMSYPEGGDSMNSAAKASMWGHSEFGDDSRFVVFIIDMTNRHLDIVADKPLSETLTSAVLNSIADNVYRYASRGEYADCAVETFRLVENVLKDEGKQNEFIFREKIKWNMTPKEVTDLEGNEFIQSEANNITAIIYVDVPISKYKGQLGYLFAEDRLISCMYAIKDPEDEARDYIKKGLDKVYGDEVEVSSSEILEIVKALAGKDEGFADPDNTSYQKWVYTGGTRIYLISELNTLEIMYVSPECMNILQGEEIDITGL